MKSLNVPFVEGLEKMNLGDFEEVMRDKGVSASVNEANWGEYPYCPKVVFSIARSRTHLFIKYSVRGLDLRAMALEDNGNVWEDSCCEFFVSHPSDGTYYNFEMNCIGTLLASKRYSREASEKIPPSVLKRVIRHSTLPHERVEERGKVFEWEVWMGIPLDLMGLDSENLPPYLMANFYKCGDKTGHPHFLSWNPISTPAPDFHRPEFFGKIIF